MPRIGICLEIQEGTIWGGVEDLNRWRQCPVFYQIQFLVCFGWAEEPLINVNLLIEYQLHFWPMPIIIFGFWVPCLLYSVVTCVMRRKQHDSCMRKLHSEKQYCEEHCRIPCKVFGLLRWIHCRGCSGLLFLIIFIGFSSLE